MATTAARQLIVRVKLLVHSVEHSILHSITTFAKPTWTKHTPSEPTTALMSGHLYRITRKTDFLTLCPANATKHSLHSNVGCNHKYDSDVAQSEINAMVDRSCMHAEGGWSSSLLAANTEQSIIAWPRGSRMTDTSAGFRDKTNIPGNFFLS